MRGIHFSFFMVSLSLTVVYFTLSDLSSPPGRLHHCKVDILANGVLVMYALRFNIPIIFSKYNRHDRSTMRGATFGSISFLSLSSISSKAPTFLNTQGGHGMVEGMVCFNW